ncbi:unnamed protein product, partial [Closterium sp. Naga37s-1]
ASPQHLETAWRSCANALSPSYTHVALTPRTHSFFLPLLLQGFSSAPRDCLAFMCYRAAGESSGEERREWVERGLAAAVSESARARLRELQ